MIRALYTSASAMWTQQYNMDTIGNNISNVLTVGFKKTRPSFKEAMYDAMEKRQGGPRPNLQVGSGVSPGYGRMIFKQGTMQNTGNQLNLAIEGQGFFTIQGDNGSRLYTRNGNFRIVTMNDGGFQLANHNGHPVLDEDDRPIRFNQNPGEDGIIVKGDGMVYVKDEEGEVTPYARLGIRTFINPEGLGQAGGSYFFETVESGPPISGQAGNVVQGFLEGSNVEMYEEMSNLIMAQRAYQLSSRVLQSADEMERQANNLRG